MSVVLQMIGVSLLGQGTNENALLGLSTDSFAAATKTETTGRTAVSTSASASQQQEASTKDLLKFGCLLNYTIKDVKLSENEDQPTAKGKRSILTRLIGIGNAKTMDIDAKILRNWGNREKMSLRNGSKGQYAVAIVNFTEQHQRMLEQGKDKTEPTTIYANAKINYARMVNVLSHDTFTPLFLNRGTQIGRQELDNGILADQTIWETCAATYNDISIEELDNLKYNVNWQGNVPNPMQFRMRKRLREPTRTWQRNTMRLTRDGKQVDGMKTLTRLSRTHLTCMRHNHGLFISMNLLKKIWVS